MKESTEVREALLRFYDRNTANDQAAFYDVITRSEAISIIGSSAREWFQGQEAAHAAYGLERVKIEAGDVQAWEEGTAGWAINKPTFVLPDGTRMRMRMTTIFVLESGGWRLIHLHGSTPVPDEVYLEHQTEWWPAA
jgi:hypothetical protein